MEPTVEKSKNVWVSVIIIVLMLVIGGIYLLNNKGSMENNTEESAVVEESAEMSVETAPTVTEIQNIEEDLGDSMNIDNLDEGLQ
ncbi:MAG: hypothetical protein K9L98_01490 [Candidatus Pacebacteria bacterium]|nr:hypothetical protein [Candidatus Paceibacterota bacterium]MCF7862666.1 hypothetical protein [Candidatus Paceibacterota bacterium]